MLLLSVSRLVFLGLFLTHCSPFGCSLAGPLDSVSHPRFLAMRAHLLFAFLPSALAVSTASLFLIAAPPSLSAKVIGSVCRFARTLSFPFQPPGIMPSLEAYRLTKTQDAAGATYVVSCGNKKAVGCNFLDGATVTQGPATMHYGISAAVGT